ncbi:MAG TPA: hypothetical protein VMZ90_15175, partial [Vicinamibacterales bacterium]|nr:hypothetical protein [Vicinamibacterales bacterium]
LTVPGHEFTRFFAHQPDTAFRELLSKVAPDLAQQIGRAGRARLQGFAGHVGFLRRCHGPGWALVGDAGYFKDPLTAHGITDALRDAELLARAIAAGTDEALAGYQEHRDAASEDLFDATDAIASFSWSLSEVRVLHDVLARAMSREVKQLVGAPAELATYTGSRFPDDSERRLRRIPLPARHGPTLAPWAGSTPDA